MEFLRRNGDVLTIRAFALGLALLAASQFPLPAAKAQSNGCCNCAANGDAAKPCPNPGCMMTCSTNKTCF